MYGASQQGTHSEHLPCLMWRVRPCWLPSWQAVPWATSMHVDAGPHESKGVEKLDALSRSLTCCGPCGRNACPIFVRVLAPWGFCTSRRIPDSTGLFLFGLLPEASTTSKATREQVASHVSSVSVLHLRAAEFLNTALCAAAKIERWRCNPNVRGYTV